MNKKLLLLASLALLLAFSNADDTTANSTETTTDQYFNILSLDGGGIRGLITAVVVQYMEQYAYSYASEYYNFPYRAYEKISMAELFDMVSGTSTGSLLATAIVLPNTNYSDTTDDTNSTNYYKNRYWAKDCIEIYTQKGSTVFTTYTLGTGYQLLGAFIFALVGGAMLFGIGICMYHDYHHEETMEQFLQYIKSRKSVKKGKGSQNVDTTLSTSLDSQLKHMMSGLVMKKAVEEGDYNQIKKVEERIIEEDLKYREKKGRKYILLVIGFFLSGITGWYLMPYLHKMTHSLYNRSGIQEITLEMFGYIPISDALTEEVMIVSYDYNNHEPQIFSKFTALTQGADYNVLIKDAAEASSAAPFYFDPKVIRDQVLIDGGVIANSPSLYSYLHARFINKKDKIRLISIGTGTTQAAELDPDDITTVTWLSEIASLITTVEQNTHDYLNKDLLGEDQYYRFQSLMSESLGLDAISDEDLAKLIQYGNDVVTERKDDLHKVIQEIVDERMYKFNLTKVK